MTLTRQSCFGSHLDKFSRFRPENRSQRIDKNRAALGTCEKAATHALPHLRQEFIEIAEASGLAIAPDDGR
jgi:hypothetical protein